jgi:hypothetical protein
MYQSDASSGSWINFPEEVFGFLGKSERFFPDLELPLHGLHHLYLESTGLY